MAWPKSVCDIIFLRMFGMEYLRFVVRTNMSDIFDLKESVSVVYIRKMLDVFCGNAFASVTFNKSFSCIILTDHVIS